MALSAADAVELLRFAGPFSQRLDQAAAELAGRPGAEREKQWLAAAGELLAEALRKSSGLLERARGLPELVDLRGELAESVQSAWVDSLEKLLAGITFHVTSRSPVIEALYPTQKLAPLRRAPPAAVRKFQSDFEKRLKSGYVSRMLATDDFAFAEPVIGGIREAYTQWESCFEPGDIAEADASALRDALLTAAQEVDMATRQARHLAEAALLPFPGSFEEHQLGAKPKKRARSEERDRRVQPAPAPSVPADSPPGPSASPAEAAPAPAPTTAAGDRAPAPRHANAVSAPRRRKAAASAPS